ncbi:MAG: VCBS repeat-containing protein [bacterium]|nr:VCBS repeat-containing protein [bacterium]
MTVTNGVRDYFWLDLDGDDWLDLMVQYINYWQLYRNDNGVRFVDITAQANLPPTTDNAMFALADYDLDNDMDIFMPRIYGQDYFYRNDGDGVFADVTEEVGLLGSAARAGCVFVDMNNDKYPDLVAPGNGTHAVWLNHHGEYFEGATVHGAEADFESMPFPWGARYAAGDLIWTAITISWSSAPAAPAICWPKISSCAATALWVWMCGFTNMAGDWGLDALEDGLPRFADFDDDGDLDLILMLHDQPPLLYRNLTNGAGRLEVSVAGPNGEEYGWHRRVELYPHGSETVLCATVLGEDAVGINGMSNYFAVEPQQAYDIEIHLENGEILSPQSHPQLANVVPAGSVTSCGLSWTALP